MIYQSFKKCYIPFLGKFRWGKTTKPLLGDYVSLTKNFSWRNFCPINIFTRRILSNNQNLLEKVTKVTYFSSITVLVTKNMILKLILTSRYLQKSLLIIQLKSQMIAMLPASVTRLQKSCCKGKIIFWF